jgi:hypothetical protein
MSMIFTDLIAHRPVYFEYVRMSQIKLKLLAVNSTFVSGCHLDGLGNKTERILSINSPKSKIHLIYTIYGHARVKEARK